MTPQENQQDPVFRVMSVDLLSNALGKAESPVDLAIYLTEQLLKLTGARCVLLKERLGGWTSADHRLLLVNPASYRSWAESAEAERLYRIVHDLPDMQLIREDEPSELASRLKQGGFGSSVAIPLSIENSRIGTVLILGLGSEQQISSLLPLLRDLSTPMATILRISVLFDHQARMIQRHADQLQAANEQLQEELAERKRAEEATRRAKDAADAANRAKDQFLAVLSHELRTPLTPVLATISSLESHPETPPEFRADVELIRRNVELETRLIDDLLDFTRAIRGKVKLHCEVIDVHAALQAALQTCEAGIQTRQLTVAMELRARNHHVWADSARLQQVFWNLLQNAAKFTPERGTIQLRSRNRNGRIEIQVVDTGIGIEPAMLPKIFDAFVQAEQTKTRRFGGLGLGLAIARNLVELHQGHLTAFSAGPNQGATFTVDLAVTASGAAAKTSVPRPAEAQGNRPERRILLVEDIPDTLRILSRLLRSWGYQVTEAQSVAAALQAARLQPFDLLVSDIGLPDGSGLEIMREVKQAYGLRGIALSGYGMEEDVEQSRAAGFERHLVKPVSAKALETAVREALLHE